MAYQTYLFIFFISVSYLNLSQGKTMQKKSLLLGGVFLLTSLLNSATLTSQNNHTSLIIYATDLALVSETVALNLGTQEKTISYDGFPNSIISDSIHLKLPPEVELHSRHFNFSTQKQLFEADVQDDAILFRSTNKPATSKPTLTYNITANKAIKTDLQLQYLMSDITFQTHYRLKFDEDSSTIEGFITIDNRSTKSFSDAKVSLLFGETQSHYKPTPHLVSARAFVTSDMQQTAVAHEDYYLYPISKPLTLPSATQTQIVFAHKEKISTQKIYTATLNHPIYLRGEVNADVFQSLSLGALPFVLPKGVVRTYSKFQNQQILLGETEIQNTPKDTPLTLTIGKSFDLKVTETLLSAQQNAQTLSTHVEYKIINKSAKSKMLTLLIPFTKDINSKIKTQQEYRFTKGNFVTFSILVAPNATEKFNVHFESKQ